MKCPRCGKSLDGLRCNVCKLNIDTDELVIIGNKGRALSETIAGYVADQRKEDVRGETRMLMPWVECPGCGNAVLRDAGKCDKCGLPMHHSRLFERCPICNSPKKMKSESDDFIFCALCGYTFKDGMSRKRIIY